MQSQLPSNSYVPGLNGVQSFPNWNWNMQTFPPPFLGAPGPSSYGDLGFNNVNIQSNIGQLNANSDKDTIKSGKDSNNGTGMNFPFQQQMAVFPEQFSMMQQQGMMNKMNAMNPFMFQNLNLESLIPTDSKPPEVPASISSFGLNVGTDVSNQLAMKKERISPPPFLFPGPYQTMPNYVNSQNNNASGVSDSFLQSTNTSLNSFAPSSQAISSVSTINGFGKMDSKESIMPTPPQTPSPFYGNPFSNPIPNFWNGNFMYNNPPSFPPFFNQMSPFGGPPNLMNSSQIINNPFHFPNNQQFNPFLASPEMAAFQNGYFPPNLQQQQNLFQQQQNEQLLAMANQQLQQPLPSIKQESDVPFEACPTPKNEDNIKQEDDQWSSSQTDEESNDKLIKPRKSSKCQCPNCTNPSTEDESAKLIKKHACHWPGCPKTYGKTSHLKSHIRQHQGIRPFICPDQTCMKVLNINVLFQYSFITSI